MKHINYIKNFCILFLALNISWIIFSQDYGLQNIFIGFFVSFIASYVGITLDKIIFKEKFSIFVFIYYIFWLLIQILISSLKVSKIILSKEIKINAASGIIKTKLKNNGSIALFANSVTLTPGTVCTSIDDNKLYIHALDKQDIEDLEYGIMEKIINKVGN